MTTIYMDESTRVALKWRLPWFDYIFCLQRKKWWGWKTTAKALPWYDPDRDFSDLCKYLYWEEKHQGGSKGSKEIGREILSRISK